MSENRALFVIEVRKEEGGERWIEKCRRKGRKDMERDLALMISSLFGSFHVEMIPDPDLTYGCRSGERIKGEEERKVEFKTRTRPAFPIN